MADRRGQPRPPVELIDSSGSLRDALRAIEQSLSKIAVVVDAQRRPLGTLTDGDIRRALLAGAGLDAAVTTHMNAVPELALRSEGPGRWLARMRRTRRAQLPIVDDQGCVVDVVSERQLLRAMPRHDNLVFVMAGGLGTRLRPLTEDVPKPMLPLGSKPLLEHILTQFAGQGFHRFCFAVNYKAEQIISHFGDGREWDVSIQYLQEQGPLGTAGALGLLTATETKPIIVINGDVVTRLHFPHLLDFHRDQGGAATVCAKPHMVDIPYGVLDLEGSRIAALREKPTIEVPVNAGIYCLDWRMVELLRECQTREPANPRMDMTDLLSLAMARGLPVHAYPLQDYWIDIGRIDDLNRARQDHGDGAG